MASARKQSTSKPIPTKAAKQQVEVVPVKPNIDEPIQVPHIDTHRARRAVPRDAAIVLALDTSFQKAVHLHDPIDPHETDSIFAFAVKGLTDQMLLPTLTIGLLVLEGGDLSFQCDTEPVAPGSDRHASKLIRKRLQKRKQSYAATRKTSVYGNYAASQASSRAESRFGGSRFGGSRASIRLASNVHKMPLVFGLKCGDESMINSSWIDSQQESTGTASSNAWLRGRTSISKSRSPPSSVTGTARIGVDFVELQRRADIKRDLSTRESIRRSNDEIDRKNDLRLKLRSLADPTVSLEKEEAMMASLGAKGQRLQQSRQGTRGKTPQASLSSLDRKRLGIKGLPPSALVPDETATFRAEDYDGLTSDVVLFGKGGELLVGENCFVIEQKLRKELLLDLNTRGVVQLRIQLVATPKSDEKNTSDDNSPARTTRLSPSRRQRVPSPPKQGLNSSASDFGYLVGSFESSPGLALDLQATPLSTGVILKLPDAPDFHTQDRNAPRKASKRASISESVANAKLDNQLSPLIRTPGLSKPALGVSQSDSALQTQKSLPSDVPSPLPPPNIQSHQATKQRPSAGSPVLPKHLHNGEKHLQNLRIRTPAYPTRKTLSRSSEFVDSAENGWNGEDVENLFSLHEHASTGSLPNVKYVREFPKPAQGRIQLFGTAAQKNDWTLPTPSPFSFPSTATTAQHKR